MLSVLNDFLRGVFVSLVIVLHENVGLFQLLKGVSDDFSRSSLVMVLSLSGSLRVSVNVSQSSNSGVWLKGNESGQSSSSYVEPVGLLWGNFLSNSGLDESVVGQRGDFGLFLQLFGKGSDEALCWNVFDGNVVSECSSDHVYKVYKFNILRMIREKQGLYLSALIQRI